MSVTFIRIQTYFVCAVVIGCFSLLYPRIFHPMLMHLLGLNQNTEHSSVDVDPPIPHHFTTHADRPRKPSFRVRETENEPVGKRGGIMSMILPFYGVGIVLYLVYTLTRLCKSKKRESRNKKDDYLRHYYRDFHYDPKRSKFRMNYSSSEDEADGDEGDLLQSERRRGMKNNEHASGLFDWASTCGYEDQSNIYRSATSLPRDLETLLAKLESENLDTQELSSLRMRLEQTEKEMTHLLAAMDYDERIITRKPRVNRGDSGVSCDAESFSEAPVTASEGEED